MSGRHHNHYHRNRYSYSRLYKRLAFAVVASAIFFFAVLTVGNYVDHNRQAEKMQVAENSEY